MESRLMNAGKRWQIIADRVERPVGLASLVCLHIAAYCLSLVKVTYFKNASYFSADTFHIFYDPAWLLGAVVVVAVFAPVGFLFAFARFSFGYFIGFYLYTMILGYLWINCFSDLRYDHRLAGLSAAASAVAFLVPAMLISSPIKRPYKLSVRAFERLLTFFLLLALATIVAGAFYSFRFVAISEIYDYRDKLEFPVIIAYLIGITSGVLLPFAFACFLARKNYWRAGFVLILALLFYPITLSKLAIFASAWLVFIALLSRFFGARTTAVLSLSLPMLAGNLTLLLHIWPDFFYIADFRMMMIPSGAMDIYNHYFSDHQLTHFCQIWILKPFVSCSYGIQLSILMQNVYELGNLNASLFATEGIASVGPVWAPVSAFVCGLVIAFGNRLSAGLPPRLILISAAILPLVFLNVPLATTLLTHGTAILFLLWWITPREIFEQEGSGFCAERKRAQ
jgi:hypothetical protein